MKTQPEFNLTQRAGNPQARFLQRRQPLADASPMPFGKHKGQRMMEVSMKYWRWFLDQPWCSQWPAVEAYARNAIQPSLVPCVRRPEAQ